MHTFIVAFLTERINEIVWGPYLCEILWHMQKQSMYEALYEAYGRIIAKEAEERNSLGSHAHHSCKRRRMEEVEKQILLLEKKKNRLSELPAFSSMRQVFFAFTDILSYPIL